VASRGLRLAYITGRHLSLALEGITGARLPRPDWLVCDVGTSVYAAYDGGFAIDSGYRLTMERALGGAAMADVDPVLDAVGGLRRQETVKQAEFKRSYYVDADRMHPLLTEVRQRLESSGVRVQLVHSRDPVSGAGLLDVLPAGSGKRCALTYLTGAAGLGREAVAYAGDSGNDRDALLSGHPAIVVGNAPEDLKAELRHEARARGLDRWLYVARAHFASGVLEGCRHFGFL